MAKISSLVTFKQFISEGRDAPLYHATNFVTGAHILFSGMLEPRTAHLRNKLLIDPHNTGYSYDPDDVSYRPRTAKGISTTRSLRFAKEWSKGIIFQLNQARLARAYRLIPIDYWRLDGRRARGDSESEEFILTNKYVDIDRYVDRFYIHKRCMITNIDQLIDRYQENDPNFVAMCKNVVFNNPKFAGLT